MSVHCTSLYFAVLVVSLFTGMAEVSKQYNLRSSKTDPVHLPVQLQFSGDSQFVAQLLKQQEHSVPVSDSNSSDSDLNCSYLVQSDDETNNTKNPNVSIVASDISEKQSTIPCVSQDTINAQIQCTYSTLDSVQKVLSAKRVLTLQRSRVLRKSKSIRPRSHCHRYTKNSSQMHQS